jgi:hypothetical protein
MRRRGTLFVTFAAVFCTALASHAREHDDFERGEDTADSYYKAIRKILWQGWRPDVVLRMIVRPPFDEEYIMGVRRVGHEYRCFVISPTSHIWSEEVKRLDRKKPDFSHIRGKFDETPVPEDIVKRIAAIWRKGINDPRSYLSAEEKSRIITLDSTEFYFLVGLRPGEHLAARTSDCFGPNASAMSDVGFGLTVYAWHGMTKGAYVKALAKAERTLGIQHD